MKVKHLTAVLMLALMVMMSQAAYAENASVQPKESGHSARTILMYVCGSDLETEAGLASFNLNQILGADFSADEDVKFIVMTGGSYQWMLDDDKDSSNDNGRLVFPEDVSLPDNAVYLHEATELLRTRRQSPKTRSWETPGH